MNSFSKALALMKVVGYWNRIEQSYKENGMKLTTNFWLQLVAIATQAVNQFGGIFPVKWQPWIMLALGAAQGAVGIVAHNSNTDGTPQTTAFVPK